MFDKAIMEETADSAEIADLDISAFSHADVVNVVLQRSDVLADVPKGGRLIRAWSDGDGAALDDLVAERGDTLLRRGIAIAQMEYTALKPVLDKLSPKHIADIGCGYGFFDFFACRDFDCDVTLIDLEDNGERHFGFQESGAAYTSLKTAGRFLKDNGIADKRVTSLNPRVDDVNAVKDVDLAVSFLSCGFHYPLSVYETFWSSVVTDDGAIIVDLRQAKRDSQLIDLVALGQTSALWDGAGWTRVLCKKPVFQGA